MSSWLKDLLDGNRLREDAPSYGSVLPSAQTMPLFDQRLSVSDIWCQYNSWLAGVSHVEKKCSFGKGGGAGGSAAARSRAQASSAETLWRSPPLARFSLRVRTDEHTLSRPWLTLRCHAHQRQTLAHTLELASRTVCGHVGHARVRVCAQACECACARACVRARVRACVRAC
eukprot:6191519-Pleurochrysis_carterae.AAC.1